MTKTELWLYTVEYVLYNHRRGYIQELIDSAGGNITEAMSRCYDGIGWFGRTGPDAPSIECWGEAPRTPVSAWLPGSNQFSDPPDLRVTWREVFEYAKSGKVPALQLALPI